MCVWMKGAGLQVELGAHRSFWKGVCALLGRSDTSLRLCVLRCHLNHAPACHSADRTDQNRCDTTHESLGFR